MPAKNVETFSALFYYVYSRKGNKAFNASNNAKDDLDMSDRYRTFVLYRRFMVRKVAFNFHLTRKRYLTIWCYLIFKAFTILS